MQAPEKKSSLTAFGHAFSAALTSSLKDAATLKWKVTAASELSTASHDGTATAYKFEFNGALAGASEVHVQTADLPLLGLTAATDSAGVSADDPRGLLSLVFEKVAIALSVALQDLGVSEVKVTKLEAPELVENQALEFRLQDEGSGKQIKLSLVLDAAMTTALQASAARNLAYPDAVPDTSANLDLVMDVELNVTLRFGQRQLSLREVLDLTSGSVVELDRQVDEPVELVLDGRVVARGEAVIIDGNYGMRITQVLQQVVAA